MSMMTAAIGAISTANAQWEPSRPKITLTPPTGPFQAGQAISLSGTYSGSAIKSLTIMLSGQKDFPPNFGDASMGNQTIVPSGGTWSFSLTPSVNSHPSLPGNYIHVIANNVPGGWLVYGPITIAAQTPPSGPQSFYSSNPTPGGSVGNSNNELGLFFTPQADGTVTGVRFYRVAGQPAPTTVHLWNTSNSSSPIATATVSGAPTSGWFTQNFASAVNVTAGTGYCASYAAPGNVAHDSSSPSSQYWMNFDNVGYGSGLNTFPNNFSPNNTYYADVVFNPTGGKIQTWKSFSSQGGSGIFANGYTGADGVRFRSSVAGKVLGIGFLKPGGLQAPTTVKLWDASNNLLASASQNFTGDGGTYEAYLNFGNPVTIIANTDYKATVFYSNTQIMTGGYGYPTTYGPLTYASRVHADTDTGPLDSGPFTASGISGTSTNFVDPVVQTSGFTGGTTITLVKKPGMGTVGLNSTCWTHRGGGCAYLVYQGSIYPSDTIASFWGGKPAQITNVLRDVGQGGTMLEVDIPYGAIAAGSVVNFSMTQNGNTVQVDTSSNTGAWVAGMYGPKYDPPIYSKPGVAPTVPASWQGPFAGSIPIQSGQVSSITIASSKTSSAFDFFDTPGGARQLLADGGTVTFPAGTFDPGNSNIGYKPNVSFMTAFNIVGVPNQTFFFAQTDGTYYYNGMINIPKINAYLYGISVKGKGNYGSGEDATGGHSAIVLTQGNNTITPNPAHIHLERCQINQAVNAILCLGWTGYNEQYTVYAKKCDFGNTAPNAFSTSDLCHDLYLGCAVYMDNCNFYGALWGSPNKNRGPILIAKNSYVAQSFTKFIDASEGGLFEYYDTLLTQHPMSFMNGASGLWNTAADWGGQASGADNIWITWAAYGAFGGTLSQGSLHTLGGLNFYRCPIWLCRNTNSSNGGASGMFIQWFNFFNFGGLTKFDPGCSFHWFADPDEHQPPPHLVWSGDNYFTGAAISGYTGFPSTAESAPSAPALASTS